MARVFRNYARFDIQLFLESMNKFEHQHRGEKIFKALAKSIMLDGILPTNVKEHDKVFTPKNEYEKEFWESCRELAKEDIKRVTNSIKNGKKGGRPVKEEKAVQEPEAELPPITIKTTEEEFLNWAKQMNDMAGVGGFKNTETQAAMFWNHFQSQGWRKKNGMPITDPKSAYKLWVIKDKKDEGEEEQIQNVMIEVD